MLLANRYSDESLGDGVCARHHLEDGIFPHDSEWTSLISSIQLQYSACLYIDNNEM